ncbi:MAG: hypothetical protein ACOZQL_39495 [Myxococcota bacterium]
MTRIAMVLVALVGARSPAGQFKLAAPGLQSVKIAPESVTFFNDHLTQRLLERGVSVISNRDVQTVLGLERQRQLLSCNTDDSSCLAELVGALGVDGIIQGNVGQFGASLQLDLKVLAAGTATVLATSSARADSEEALLRELDLAADRLVSELQQRFPDREVVRQRSLKPVAWTVGALGLVAAGTGGVLLGLAQSKAAALTNAQSLGEAELLRREGTPLELAGWVSLGVGAAALTTGVVMLLSERPPPVVAGLLLTPHGAAFGLSGGFP